MLVAFAHALHIALAGDAIFGVALGTIVGLVFGAIPGLTFSMALALMLPVTFAMSATAGMAVLIGTYMGGMTGGSVSAVLLGIPGTPSAAATVLDGHPMAKQGRASLAMGTAVIVSAFGGIFSLIVMILVAEPIASMAIAFGPAEIFALVLFGLSTICGLAEKSLLRGMIAGVLGLMLVVIGLDPIMGSQRLTFGVTDLLQGVNLVVAMIGLFAVPQVLSTFLDYRRNGPSETGALANRVRAELPRWRDLRKHLWLMVRCAVIGTGVGAIPGTGGPIAAFLAYDHARRFSRRREAFGTGELAGVVAPETANNAVTGGALIPLFTLGIPGDPATAVMLGGLMIHGLTPGPMLFQNNLSEVYAVYIAVVLSYAMILVVQLLGIRFFVKVLQIPHHYMAVAILVMCGIGSYAIRNSIFDVYTMGVLGGLGYVLLRVRIPIPPVVLGLVLGGLLESEYRHALTLSAGNFAVFYTSATADLFFALTLAIIVLQAVSMLRGALGRRGRPRGDIVAGPAAPMK
jgi:putative tricarboxylic transport membrane protein